MDKASDYESGDSRFESWRGRPFFIYLFSGIAHYISVNFWCFDSFRFKSFSCSRLRAVLLPVKSNLNDSWRLLFANHFSDYFLTIVLYKESFVSNL